MNYVSFFSLFFPDSFRIYIKFRKLINFNIENVQVKKHHRCVKSDLLFQLYERNSKKAQLRWYQYFHQIPYSAKEQTFKMERNELYLIFLKVELGRAGMCMVLRKNTLFPWCLPALWRTSNEQTKIGVTFRLNPRSSWTGAENTTSHTTD